MPQPTASPVPRPIRVRLWTVIRRLDAGEWQWLPLDLRGRRCLGLQTTGGHRWRFRQNAAGCWLEPLN